MLWNYVIKWFNRFFFPAHLPSTVTIQPLSKKSWFRFKITPCGLDDWICGRGLSLDCWIFSNPAIPCFVFKGLERLASSAAFGLRYLQGKLIFEPSGFVGVETIDVYLSRTSYGDERLPRELYSWHGFPQGFTSFQVSYKARVDNEPLNVAVCFVKPNFPKSALQDWRRFGFRRLNAREKSLGSSVIYIASWGPNPVVTGSLTRFIPDTATMHLGLNNQQLNAEVGWYDPENDVRQRAPYCNVWNRTGYDAVAYYDADCAAWITLVSLSLAVIDQSYLQIKQVCRNNLLESGRETCDVETLYP